jgi:hypothetical protein
MPMINKLKKETNMKNLILAAALGAALALGGVAVKQKLDDVELGKVRLDYAGNMLDIVCLEQRDGGEAYIIIDTDFENNIYRGIRSLMFIQLPFDLPARELNERPDLKKVPCN